MPASKDPAVKKNLEDRNNSIWKMHKDGYKNSIIAQRYNMRGQLVSNIIAAKRKEESK